METSQLWGIMYSWCVSCDAAAVCLDHRTNRLKSVLPCGQNRVSSFSLTHTASETRTLLSLLYCVYAKDGPVL